MTTKNKTSLGRTAALAGLLLAAASTFMTVSVQPASAECKLGGPHCIGTTLPNPKGPGGGKLPGTGWRDPDCLAFGNCDSSELKGTEIRRPPSGSTQASLGGNRLEKR
jgi:hypothetical protein